MKNIGPFINLGWHTVPLKGSIERLPDGSKTIPEFEKGWKAKYQEHQNTTLARLGGAITGECSDVIAIDCDNTLTFDIFRQLDPEYEFIFYSKGKADKVCGTILYRYDADLPDNFSVNDGTIALDFYSNEGFVYLPTEANQSKETWSGRLPELKELPPIVKQVLQRFKPQVAPAVEKVAQHVSTANCLAPLVKQFTEGGKFMPGLFRIITPKAFRTEEQYVKQGYLHPENVPEGRGSEYLSKVSAILGADVSVDRELYCAAMIEINALWPEPMDSERLDSTVIEPMIQGKSTIDNKPIWTYDPEWQTHRLILTTKRQSNIELGFDDRRDTYYCVDAANVHVKTFSRDNDMVSYVGSVAMSPPSKAIIKSSIPIINAGSFPGKEFGFLNESDPMARTLNVFVRTPELAILNDPEPYAAMYRRPQTTLRFLESLIPEDKMREYVLRFLKRKLTTFEYSPVVLYFLGVHGSGKDTFVAILEKIIGSVARPTVKEFLEKHNAWMLDTYFVQLDEYGNQLTNLRDKEEALGKLKAYTGKQNIQIRQMRSDGFNYKHHATFISTANKNPFGVEDGDRRICLLHTPNVLAEQPWVQDMEEVYYAILDETKDFAYFLATEVGDCEHGEYQKPPESQEKKIVIADSMFAAQRIAFVLKNGMIDYLKNLAKDHNSAKVLTAISTGRLRANDLEELYDAMTDYKGEMRSLNKALRVAGIDIVPTTTGGVKDYYYNIPGLDYSGPFGEVDDES